jgi:hypothetical protein
MASTRLRPSSIFVFCSLQTSTHFDPAQYLKHHTAIARIAAEVAWVADEVEVVVATLDGARLHDWVPGLVGTGRVSAWG